MAASDDVVERERAGEETSDDEDLQQVAEHRTDIGHGLLHNDKFWVGESSCDSTVRPSSHDDYPAGEDIEDCDANERGVGRAWDGALWVLGLAAEHRDRLKAKEPHCRKHDAHSEGAAIDQRRIERPRAEPFSSTLEKRECVHDQDECDFNPHKDEQDLYAEVNVSEANESNNCYLD